MNLFQMGSFYLSSGRFTSWRINAERLTDEDIRTCAYLLARIIPTFGKVEGIPTGGIPLAEAMSSYCESISNRLLIVDDVWTTGGSWERYRNGRDAIGAVIFARGETPSHVAALWSLNRKVINNV